jgi:hypothetical protein
MPFKVPDPPYIAAGALGGPFVVYLVTPLRNALTLAALDKAATIGNLFGQVFRNGFRPAFGGGLPMAKAAVPGFLVLGPAFHMYKDLVGGSSLGAVALTAVSESLIFYGAESNNAQTAFNQKAAKQNTAAITKLHNPMNPIGGGFGLHVMRNVCAMSGLRVLSGPCQYVLERLSPDMSPTTKIVASDLLANIAVCDVHSDLFFSAQWKSCTDNFACISFSMTYLPLRPTQVSALSAPLHQLYGWSVTTRVAQTTAGATEAFMPAAMAFLKTQYLKPDGKISTVAGRDMTLRVIYNASIFTLYGLIERSFVSNWPSAWQWPISST